MKFSNVIKLILCIMLILNLIMASGIVYADSDSSLGDLDNFNGGKKGGSSTKLETKVELVMGVIQIVGVVVSVVTLMAIGIKYMLGSVEEKSEYKQTMIPYLIGAAIVFSGTTFPQIIYKIAKNI